MRLPRTAAELIRTSAHRYAPSLSPVAMVAHFISFLRYFYFNSCGFPSAYTRSYSNPYGYSLLCAAPTSALKATPFSTLLFVSIRLTQLHTQAYALAYAQPRSSNSSSFNLTSCIRPQRLYSPALRPSLLDRTDPTDRLNQTFLHVHCFSVPRL